MIYLFVPVGNNARNNSDNNALHQWEGAGGKGKVIGYHIREPTEEKKGVGGMAKPLESYPQI